MKLILASSSPRRHELLSRLNHPFDVIPPDVDESLVPIDGSPEEYCQTLAVLKADCLSCNYPQALVIAADTIVVVDSQILGKPVDKAQAVQMLEKLSGKTHNVLTGVNFQWQEKGIRHTFAELTSVTFRELDLTDINHYIESYPPYDKAGSYGIQDWSAVFVETINGCYDNVVGFPLSRFYLELNKCGINLLDTISEPL